MTRLVPLVVTLVGLSGCLREHAEGAMELTSDQCYTCHRPDYEGVMSPDRKSVV